MKTKIVSPFIFLAIVILVTSCTTSPEQKKARAEKKSLSRRETEIFDAASKLESVEDSQNYSGKIAVSELDFVANKGQFNINFNEDASNYVQDARNNISGDASSSVQTAMYFGALLQGGATGPGSTLGTNNSLGQTSLPNQAETAVNSFSAPPSININPTVDERDAVEKGINDKLAEKFLEFMSNPDSNSNKEEAVVFGVMQATCQPGQNTRKGYLAELDITLRYGRQETYDEYTTNLYFTDQKGFRWAVDDNGQFIKINTIDETNDSGSETVHIVSNNEVLTDISYFPARERQMSESYVDEGSHPNVLAVLPLMDTRNMALQNNNQSQLEVAEELSAAYAAKGMSAAAKILSDYVKRQQSNIETRNSLPVATTFSDGSDFGIQLYPSVEAIENPGKTGSSAADVLEPITFPIVVAIKVDKRDVYGDTNNPMNMLVTEVQTRWVPIKSDTWQWLARHGWRVLFDDVFDYSQLYQRMLRAKNIDDAKKELADAEPDGNDYPNTISGDYYYQYEQAQMALDSLESSALGNLTLRPLPDLEELFPANKSDTKAPAITDVFPHIIWRDTSTDFVIIVKGVPDTNDLSKVNIAGVTCTNTAVFQYISSKGTNDASTVTNVAIEATLPQAFYSITNNVTNNVDFVVLFNDQPPATKTVGMLLQGKSMPQASATITRDSNGKLLGINIQPGQDLNSSNLLRTINQVLQKSEPAPNQIIVH